MKQRMLINSKSVNDKHVKRGRVNKNGKRYIFVHVQVHRKSVLYFTPRVAAVLRRLCRGTFDRHFFQICLLRYLPRATGGVDNSADSQTGSAQNTKAICY